MNTILEENLPPQRFVVSLTVVGFVLGLGSIYVGIQEGIGVTVGSLISFAFGFSIMALLGAGLYSRTLSDMADRGRWIIVGAGVFLIMIGSVIPIKYGVPGTLGVFTAVVVISIVTLVASMRIA